MKVHWTDTAQEHLDAIYAYIAKDSTYYALRMVGRLTRRSQQIADLPLSGRRVPEYDLPKSGKYSRNHTGSSTTSNPTRLMLLRSSTEHRTSCVLMKKTTRIKSMLKLSDQEKQEIVRFVEAGKPLPEKYRCLLFDGKQTGFVPA